MSDCQLLYFWLPAPFSSVRVLLGALRSLGFWNFLNQGNDRQEKKSKRKFEARAMYAEHQHRIMNEEEALALARKRAEKWMRPVSGLRRLEPLTLESLFTEEESERAIKKILERMGEQENEPQSTDEAPATLERAQPVPQENTTQPQMPPPLATSSNPQDQQPPIEHHHHREEPNPDPNLTSERLLAKYYRPGSGRKLDLSKLNLPPFPPCPPINVPKTVYIELDLPIPPSAVGPSPIKESSIPSTSTVNNPSCVSIQSEIDGMPEQGAVQKHSEMDENMVDSEGAPERSEGLRKSSGHPNSQQKNSGDGQYVDSCCGQVTLGGVGVGQSPTTPVNNVSVLGQSARTALQSGRWSMSTVVGQRKESLGENSVSRGITLPTTPSPGSTVVEVGTGKRDSAVSDYGTPSEHVSGGVGGLNRQMRAPRSSIKPILGGACLLDAHAGTPEKSGGEMSEGNDSVSVSMQPVVGSPIEYSDATGGGVMGSIDQGQESGQEGRVNVSPGAGTPSCMDAGLDSVEVELSKHSESSGCVGGGSPSFGSMGTIGGSGGDVVEQANETKNKNGMDNDNDSDNDMVDLSTPPQECTIEKDAQGNYIMFGSGVRQLGENARRQSMTFVAPGQGAGLDFDSNLNSNRTSDLDGGLDVDVGENAEAGRNLEADFVGDFQETGNGDDLNGLDDVDELNGLDGQGDQMDLSDGEDQNEAGGNEGGEQSEKRAPRQSRKRKNVRRSSLLGDNCGSKYVGGVRRTQRKCVRPLRWWAGETKIYAREEHRTLSTVVGYSLLSPTDDRKAYVSTTPQDMMKYGSRKAKDTKRASKGSKK